jgi:hypothetical protein
LPTRCSCHRFCILPRFVDSSLQGISTRLLHPVTEVLSRRYLRSAPGEPGIDDPPNIFDVRYLDPNRVRSEKSAWFALSIVIDTDVVLTVADIARLTSRSSERLHRGGNQARIL